MGRIDSVAKSAQKDGYVGQDEAPQVLALAKAGQHVAEGEGFELKSAVSRFALLATDRKVHVFRLGQVGFKSLKEEVVSLGYEEMEAEVVKGYAGRFRIRRQGEKDLWFFQPMNFGSNFKGLRSYVESRGVGALSGFS